MEEYVTIKLNKLDPRIAVWADLTDTTEFKRQAGETHAAQHLLWTNRVPQIHILKP